MNRNQDNSKRIGASRRNGGFTISESLAALIILLLVTAIVAAGIPAAARSYERVTLASTSEVLLSTSMSALRNELSSARDVTILNNGDSLQYYNVAFGSMSTISKDSSLTDENGDGNIMYSRYSADDLIQAYPSKSQAEAPVSLVTDEAAGKDLFVTFDKVSLKPHDNVIRFTNLRVVKKSTGEVTTAVAPVYSIRMFSK